MGSNDSKKGKRKVDDSMSSTDSKKKKKGDCYVEEVWTVSNKPLSYKDVSQGLAVMSEEEELTVQSKNVWNVIPKVVNVAGVTTLQGEFDFKDLARNLDFINFYKFKRREYANGDVKVLQVEQGCDANGELKVVKMDVRVRDALSSPNLTLRLFEMGKVVVTGVATSEQQHHVCMMLVKMMKALEHDVSFDPDDLAICELVLDARPPVGQLSMGIDLEGLSSTLHKYLWGRLKLKELVVRTYPNMGGMLTMVFEHNNLSVTVFESGRIQISGGSAVTPCYELFEQLLPIVLNHQGNPMRVVAPFMPPSWQSQKTEVKYTSAFTSTRDE